MATTADQNTKRLGVTRVLWKKNHGAFQWICASAVHVVVEGSWHLRKDTLGRECVLIKNDGFVEIRGKEIS